MTDTPVRLNGAAIISELQAAGSVLPPSVLPAAYKLPPATSSALGGVKPGAGLAVAGDGTLLATASAYTLPTATTTALGGVKVDGSTVTINGSGVISAVPSGGSAAFTRTAYTASGAIAITNTLAILNGTTALAMTLANGTTDGQGILIKQLGTADATVQATMDGASQTVTLAASAAGTIRDALKLRWSTADTTWLAE